jgi:hypothetical protein
LTNYELLAIVRAPFLSEFCTTMLALNAPVTLLAEERADRLHFSYDEMTSLLCSYRNPDALQVPKHLDNKVDTLCAKRQHRYSLGYLASELVE